MSKHVREVSMRDFQQYGCASVLCDHDAIPASADKIADTTEITFSWPTMRFRSYKYLTFDVTCSDCGKIIPCKLVDVTAVGAKS